MYRLHTLWGVHVDEVRLCSEHDLLQDDSETVDVAFLSSVDRSNCHTQQLRRRPQLMTIISKLILIHLHQNTVVRGKQTQKERLVQYVLSATGNSQ